MDAYLQSISYTKPTSTTCTMVAANTTEERYGSMTCGNIKYYTWSGCDYISVISKNNTRSLKLYVEYVGDSLNSYAVTQKNAQISVSYTDDYNARLFESSWEC